MARVAQLAFVLLLGCGARTGLRNADGGDADGGAPDAIGVDRAVPPDARPPPDASVVLACDGLPLPRPGAVSAFDVPPRIEPLATAIPDPLGLLVVGGRTSSTDVASEMLFFDLASERVDVLDVLGDPVDVPTGSGVAVYVSDGDRIVVVGGRTAEEAPTDRAFSFTGEGDPTGLRAVRALTLPPYPPGPVGGHAGVYDPRANRVVIHGGRDDAGTWTLDLDGPPTWRALTPPDRSPPPGSRAMGYDPTAHRAILITDDEDGDGVAVYALDLEPGAERWERLGPIDFVPSLGGELVWDERACGFHLLSARRTRCVLEHWVLVIEAGAAPTTVFRAELELEPPHFLAGARFIPGTREILAFGGENCDAPGVPNPVVHRIGLVR